MRSSRALVAALAGMLVALVVAGPAQAGHGTADNQEDMSHLANVPKPDTTNSDLAFWGDLVYAGNYDGFRIIDASDSRDPKVLSDYECYGPQNDVGVWDTGPKRLLFLSVDSRQQSDECSGPGNPVTGWEGIRIFDVTDPRHPRFIDGVATDCGSHTHTVVPARVTRSGEYVTDARRPDRVLIYVSSYPLTGHGIHADDEESSSECTAAHFKESIVEVPFRAPENAGVINEMSTRTAVGCHDVGVHLGADLAAAACLTEGQIWDISDPANPVIKEQIFNPDVQIWHSGSFTWDAKLAIFGDEEGGAAATHGCANAADFGPGAIWFYEVDAPQVPVDSYTQDRLQGLETCTAHNYNVVPGIERDVLTSSFYKAGTGLIDFTTLDGSLSSASPFEIAYFDAAGVDGQPEAYTWSTYWYNGLAYANDIDRGLDIFEHLGPETARATRLHHLNPQTQEGFIGPRGRD